LFSSIEEKVGRMKKERSIWAVAARKYDLSTGDILFKAREKSGGHKLQGM